MIFRPDKRDIRQIEFLVKRGASQPDIESVLGITAAEFQKWAHNADIDRILKTCRPPDPDKYTMNHPDLDGQTELAFEVGLRKFYRFKDEFRCPVGRYKYVYKRFKEADLRMTKEIIEKYLDQIEGAINGGKKTGINLGTVYRVVYNMRTWLTIPFEPEAIKRLAAVVFFTEDEDLSTFDEKAGEEKIAFWMEHKAYDFFLTQPIGALLNQSNISNESLQVYLTEWTEILKELTSDLSEKSPES